MLLFGIKTSEAYTWSGYCLNDPSGVLSYYMYSNSYHARAFVTNINTSIRYWCSQSNFPVAPTLNGMHFPVRGMLSVSGKYLNTPMFETFPLFVDANYAYQIRDYYAGMISGVSNTLDKPILGSIDLDARRSYILNISTNIISQSNLYSDDQISSTWQYPEKNYLQIGYLDAIDSDIVSSSNPVVIPSTSYVYSQVFSTSTFVTFSTPVPVFVVNQSSDSLNVNIDLSTTNEKLSNIYDFLRSTYVEQSDLESISTSVEQATSVVHSIFSHFQNFFHTTSSDTWDCSLDFSTIPVLGYEFYLGKIDLCERWGWVFDLLRKLLAFGAYVMAFYILGDIE
jgi:hypothetical protein